MGLENNCRDCPGGQSCGANNYTQKTYNSNEEDEENKYGGVNQTKY